MKALYDELGVDSIAKLKEVAEAGKVAGLAGFGKKSEEKILEAIAFRETNADRFRLGDVADPAQMILDSLKSHPDCVWTIDVIRRSERRRKTGHLDAAVEVSSRATRHVINFATSWVLEFRTDVQG